MKCPHLSALFVDQQIMAGYTMRKGETVVLDGHFGGQHSPLPGIVVSKILLLITITNLHFWSEAINVILKRFTPFQSHCNEHA